VTDTTARFSGRASAYAAARPAYPEGVASVLEAECGLRSGCVACDLGSGTGIFTRLLLAAGATVYAVEPNDDMRAEAEAQLASAPAFHSIAGRSEATTLPDASVDLVTAAQAFHWFDVAKTRREVARILRPNGWAALVWNDRDTSATPFHVEFEGLLVESCPAYRRLQGKSDTPAAFDAFFGPGAWTRRTVPHTQHLDREGLVSRVFSTSYAPPHGAPGHTELARDVRALFDRHADAGAITIVYSTVVVFGHCTATDVTTPSDSASL
jgi:SAM-dependent methyltransferase